MHKALELQTKISLFCKVGYFRKSNYYPPLERIYFSFHTFFVLLPNHTDWSSNLIYFTNCPVVFLNALYPKDWASYYVYVLVIVLTILNFLTSMNFSSQIAHLSHNFQSIKQHFSHYPCFSLYVHLLFFY